MQSPFNPFYRITALVGIEYSVHMQYHLKLIFTHPILADRSPLQKMSFVESIIYITISTFTAVRPYGVVVVVVVTSRHVTLSSFQFLQVYDKVSLIKVGWYVLKVKNIHSWSPPDPLVPWDKEKASYIHYDIKREEAKLRILKLASAFHHLPSVGPKQLCALAHLGCTREAGTS